MKADTPGRGIVEISIAILVIIGGFFIVGLAFGLGERIFESPEGEQVNPLEQNIISQRGEIVEVQPLEEEANDPDPVPTDQREYPAQRIVRLNNMQPITFEEAKENLLLERELRRQQEELLKALDIENNEEEGRYVLQLLERLGSVNARSFLVGDLDSGEVIFERKAHEVYPIASITKFFTAFTAALEFNAAEIATVDAEELAVEGNRGGFQVGDRFTIRELLYPLLLVSSNDAGEIIAQQRQRSDFIAAMNTLAESENLINTSFADPTGLSQENVSTARDLFQFMRITKETYPQIVGISQLSSKQIDNYRWYNINRATQFPEFRGGKTGFTNAARQTSIGYYEIVLSNGQRKNIGIIILQSNTRQQDTRNILDYLKNDVAYRLNDEE
jgi:D-alanyl-D-alanine carboxypeptidase